MSIKYKLIEKGQPGVAGGGTKKCYDSILTDGELDIYDIVKQIENFSSLSEADIRGVVIAVENVIQEALADSKIVRLDKLGTFYPTLSSGGAATEKDFNQSLIKSAGVNYRPGKRILDTIKSKGFEKK